MARPKKEKFKKYKLDSIEDLLNMRLTKSKIIHNRNKEMKFCEIIQGDLKEIFNNLGYDIEIINREFSLQYGRCDFICKTKDNKYLISEVKVKNEKASIDYELNLSYAIGQLLTYKTIMIDQYKLKADDIDLFLIGDEDSLIALRTIQENNLNIKIIIFGEEGVKIYG